MGREERGGTIYLSISIYLHSAPPSQPVHSTHARSSLSPWKSMCGRNTSTAPVGDTARYVRTCKERPPPEFPQIRGEKKESARAWIVPTGQAHHAIVTHQRLGRGEGEERFALRSRRTTAIHGALISTYHIYIRGRGFFSFFFLLLFLFFSSELPTASRTYLRSGAGIREAPRIVLRLVVCTYVCMMYVCE